MQTISSPKSHLHITTTTTTFISPTRPDPTPISLPLFLTRTRFLSLKTNASSASNGAVTAKIKKEASYYEVLGISETAMATEIKRAYKQLARKYHPDVSPPGKVDEYTEKFIRVQEAYETLSDSTRRAMYDRDMARGMQLPFSTPQYQHFDRDVEICVDWKNRWQSQLFELKKRNSYKDDRNMTWGARMRRQKVELSKEV